MDITLIIFFILILIFSVIIHEISHGYTALYLGDRTAKEAGRLTLNPMRHIDPFGSVLLPLLLAITGAPVFGWAKPVPYSPFRLKNPKKAAGIISAAGPISNLAVAAIFSIIVRLMVEFSNISNFSEIFLLFNIVIQVNIALAIFNLLPIPPLDGSGILFSIIPDRFSNLTILLRKYGFFILIILIFSGIPFLGSLVLNIHRVLIGTKAFALFL